jgi:hypothetical protein
VFYRIALLHGFPACLCGCESRRAYCDVHAGVDVDVVDVVDMDADMDVDVNVYVVYV